jgi:hypothetical protein
MSKTKIKDIIYILIIISLTITTVYALFFRTHSSNYDTLRITQKYDKKSSMDLYFDFYKDEIYRYTVIIKGHDLSAKSKEYLIKKLQSSEKYPGVEAHVWFSGNSYTSMCVYDYNLLNEKNLKALHIDHYKGHTKQELETDFLKSACDSIQ